MKVTLKLTGEDKQQKNDFHIPARISVHSFAFIHFEYD